MCIRDSVYSGQTGALLYTFTGTFSGLLFGYPVAGAGDLDGDGHADLLSSSILATVGAIEQGLHGVGYRFDAGSGLAASQRVMQGQAGHPPFA